MARSNSPEETEIVEMALTRKLLRSMGIEDEKIEQILEAHAETVDALKEQRDQYKADAEKLPEVQRQLDELREAGDDGYEAKYNAEHKAFEDYKAQVAAEKIAAEKTALYRQLLVKNGVDEKRLDAILRVTDMSKMTVKDGKLEGEEDLSKSIKSEWEGFISGKKTKGAEVDNPPKDGGEGGGGDDLGKMTMEQYIAARKKM